MPFEFTITPKADKVVEEAVKDCLRELGKKLKPLRVSVTFTATVEPTK